MLDLWPQASRQLFSGVLKNRAILDFEKDHLESTAQTMAICDAHVLRIEFEDSKRVSAPGNCYDPRK